MLFVLLFIEIIYCISFYIFVYFIIVCRKWPSWRQLYNTHCKKYIILNKMYTWCWTGDLLRRKRLGLTNNGYVTRVRYWRSYHITLIIGVEGSGEGAVLICHEICEPDWSVQYVASACYGTAEHHHSNTHVPHCEHDLANFYNMNILFLVEKGVNYESEESILWRS